MSHFNNRTKETQEYKKKIDEKLIALGEVIYYPLEELRIDATMNLYALNMRINEIIKIINEKIDKLGDNFIPWNCVENKPEDYIKLGIIDCKNNVSLRTIQEVSELFNKGYKGTQRCHFKTIKSGTEYVWCPKLKLEDSDFKGNHYQNEISLSNLFLQITHLPHA